MKKRRNLIIVLGIIILIVIIGLAKYLIETRKEKTSITDFSSEKEIIEYDGHEYLGKKKSEEEGYEDDIYLHFSKQAINEDGTTNQALYEVVISHLVEFKKGHNFRMLDQENNIIIRIQYNEKDELSLYTINNNSKYWEYIKTIYQIDNYNDNKLTSFNIESQILENAINANWVYSNVNLGTKKSIINNYEIYKEGYKVRKIGAEIYNIVFTQDYDDEIVNGIFTTTSIGDIENILGKPTFEDTNNDIIGYKCEKFYIFFSNREISIYPPDKYDENDSKKFGKLVTELNTTGDIATFLNKLTDLYPHYATFINNNNYVEIEYPLLGFSVKMGYPTQNGIILYGNFQGWITEDIKLEDLIKEKNMPANVYTKFNNNLVFKTEGDRISNELYLDSGEEDGGE